MAEYATKFFHRSSLDAVIDFWRSQFTTSPCEDLFFWKTNLDKTALGRIAEEIAQDHKDEKIDQVQKIFKINKGREDS